MATGTISGLGTTPLGDSGTGEVTRKIIHLQSSSFVGSIEVRAGTPTKTAVAVPYKKRYLNGAVADESVVSTAITNTSLIDVDSAGVDVYLVCTAYTSGSMTYETRDLAG